MATVGIIANPAAGKDIRRLVAHGRFVSNQEKVNVLKRVLAGLASVGVQRVIMLPDHASLGRAALEGAPEGLTAEFLDMPVLAAEEDTTRAAKLMAQAGVGCIVTLGGDGTNRAVAKGSRDVPLVAVSTGTNNVFPTMVEGTLAGMAAGLVALGAVGLEKVSFLSKALEVWVDGRLQDLALVDLAVSTQRFVGARAIWDMATVHEVFLARAEPASLGLSSTGAQVRPVAPEEDVGLYLRLGPGGGTVTAPVAPGRVEPVPVRRWRLIEPGREVAIGLRHCTLALDGERSLTVLEGQQVRVVLRRAGPPVVAVDRVLREAALKGLLRGAGLRP